jgi:hypothetical protein
MYGFARPYYYVKALEEAQILFPFFQIGSKLLLT